MSRETPVRPPAEETETGAQLPTFDPTKPMIVSAWGRKGSGKSTFNRGLFRSYPYDKLAIDVNGDADPGADAVPIRRDAAGQLPGKFPDVAPDLPGAPARGPRSFVYRAEPLSATYRDDLDRAVAMGLFPQHHRTCLWIGEVGEFMPTAQSTRPHMRTLLNQNRHYLATALFDGPRPFYVDRLVLSQSDFIAVYDLPDRRDRDRIAETIGWDLQEFRKECDETFRRGKYWYLLFHTAEHKLYRCPPLPPLPETKPAPK